MKKPFLVKYGNFPPELCYSASAQEAVQIVAESDGLLFSKETGTYNVTNVESWEVTVFDLVEGDLHQIH